MFFVPRHLIESALQDQLGPLIGHCPDAVCVFSLCADSEMGISYLSVV